MNVARGIRYVGTTIWFVGLIVFFFAQEYITLSRERGDMSVVYSMYGTLAAGALLWAFGAGAEKSKEK